jgi:hypothetical protein
MNIIPALQHHLHETHAHKWTTPNPHTLTTTIHTPIPNINATLITHLTITQTNNTLHLTNGGEGPGAEQHTIDLLDPNFLQKIHQFITQL